MNESTARGTENIASASSMIRLETFALATLSYSPEGSRHFDSDYDNRSNCYLPIYLLPRVNQSVIRRHADHSSRFSKTVQTVRGIDRIFHLKIWQNFICSEKKKKKKKICATNSISISILMHARRTNVGSSLNVILHDLE